MNKLFVFLLTVQMLKLEQVQLTYCFADFREYDPNDQTHKLIVYCKGKNKETGMQKSAFAKLETKKVKLNETVQLCVNFGENEIEVCKDFKLESSNKWPGNLKPEDSLLDCTDSNDFSAQQVEENYKVMDVSEAQFYAKALYDSKYKQDETRDDYCKDIKEFIGFELFYSFEGSKVTENIQLELQDKIVINQIKNTQKTYKILSIDAQLGYNEQDKLNKIVIKKSQTTEKLI